MMPHIYLPRRTHSSPSSSAWSRSRTQATACQAGLVSENYLMSSGLEMGTTLSLEVDEKQHGSAQGPWHDLKSKSGGRCIYMNHHQTYVAIDVFVGRKQTGVRMPGSRVYHGEAPAARSMENIRCAVLTACRQLSETTLRAKAHETALRDNSLTHPPPRSLAWLYLPHVPHHGLPMMACLLRQMKSSSKQPATDTCHPRHQRTNRRSSTGAFPPAIIMASSASVERPPHRDAGIQ